MALRASASSLSPVRSSGVHMRGIFGIGLKVMGGDKLFETLVLEPLPISGRSNQGVLTVTPEGGLTKSHFNSSATNFSSCGTLETGASVSRADRAPRNVPVAAPPAATPTASLVQIEMRQ